MSGCSVFLCTPASAPQHVPELMAHMVNILRASLEYTGAAWSTYDAAFSRQAAATGLRQWSKVNPSLYTICLRARRRRWQDVIFA